MAWAPPVYEATGGYAAPSPCLSSALTIALHFCSAVIFRVYVLRIGKFFIFRLLRLVWKYALCMIGCQPAEPGLEGSTHLRCYPSHAHGMGPSRLRSHGWLRCLKPLSLFGFDASSSLMLCSYVSHLSSAFLFSRLFSSAFSEYEGEMLSLRRKSGIHEEQCSRLNNNKEPIKNQ